MQKIGVDSLGCLPEHSLIIDLTFLSTLLSSSAGHSVVHIKYSNFGKANTLVASNFLGRVKSDCQIIHSLLKNSFVEPLMTISFSCLMLSSLPRNL